MDNKQLILNSVESKILSKIKCEVCGKEFEFIAPAHLKTHGITMHEYREQFPDALLVSEGTRQKMSDNHADVSGKNHPMYGVHKYGKDAPNYGHKHTEVSKQKSRESHLGKKASDEAKQKMSDAHLGEKNHMFGKRGENAPNFGKRGEETSMYGRYHTKATKQKMSDSQSCRIGKKSGNWQGRISFLPYCEKFDDDLKERVRNFFGRCCYVCGMNEIDNGQKLSVHHVNYDKMVCCNDVKPLFVPLCKSCHSKTHGDREYWEEFFTVSINYLTQGECFIPKENGEK